MRKILFILFAISLTAVASVSPKFSLLTVGQGGEVYLLEGHSALRIQYPDGRDVSVNWGMFDFADPEFGMKFARGETDYWVDATSTPRFIYSYAGSGREIMEQPLNLSEEEALALDSLITENLRPENVVYRYRYLTDNCATRPLSLIEKAVESTGGSLSFKGESSEATWRSELARYHVHHPLYQLFINISLGADIDRPVSPREKAFSPLYLKDYVADVEIADSAGVRRLAEAPVVIMRGRPDVAGSEPSPWWVVVPLLLISIAAGWWQIKHDKLIKWFNAIVFLLIGTGGLMVAFLTFFSTQEATGANINLLWLNPLPLLVPMLVWMKSTRRIVTWWMLLNGTLLIIYIVGMPFFTQSPGPVVFTLAIIDLILTLSWLRLTVFGNYGKGTK